jgi:hypothetical protein
MAAKPDNLPGWRGLDELSLDRAWIADKMRAAQLEQDPLPHFIIENFLPPKLYDDAIRLNPYRAHKGVEWIKKEVSSQLKSKTPYWLRKQIHLPEGISEIQAEEERCFWCYIGDLFQKDGWFFDQIRKKCADYLFFRFGPLVIADDFPSFFVVEQFLQRHDQNYSLGPHTDIPTRVATCIFSFADRTGFEEFGTELCAPVDRLVRCSGRSHHSRDDFKVVKIAPYAPNNFLLFLKTPHSFHSVPPITADVPNGRYGMQFQVYQREQEIFHDLTKPKDGDNLLFQTR